MDNLFDWQVPWPYLVVMSVDGRKTVVFEWILCGFLIVVLKSLITRLSMSVIRCDLDVKCSKYRRQNLRKWCLRADLESRLWDFPISVVRVKKLWKSKSTPKKQKPVWKHHSYGPTAIRLYTSRRSACVEFPLEAWEVAINYLHFRRKFWHREWNIENSRT